MTIKVSTLKNGCAVRDVMTIRPNTLSVSWYGIATEELFIEILDNLEEVREKPREI